jgi:hypothetical protein
MRNCHKILLAGIYHILYLAFIIRNIFGLIFLVESSLWKRGTMNFISNPEIVIALAVNKIRRKINGKNDGIVIYRRINVI